MNFISGFQHLLSSDNPIFVRAREARRLPNAVITSLVLLGILAVGFVSFAIAGKAIYGDTTVLEEALDGSIIMIVPFLICVIALCLWVRLFEKRTCASIGLSRPKPVKKFAVGALVGFLMMGFTIALMALTDSVEVAEGFSLPTDTGILTVMFLALIGFIVQGSSEEILIRGWYFQSIGARHGPLVGFIVAGIVFALFHGSTGVMSNINLLLFAVFLMLYYLLDGSVWGVMGWHVAWNWSQSILFGMTLSGTADYEHTFMSLRPTGPDLLSGGSFGPEGSLFCTLAFTIGIIWILAVAGRKSTPHSSR